MKTRILLIVLALIINNGLYAQKFKSKKVNYTYNMYPLVKYDKTINAYYIQENYEANFLNGKLNVNSKKDMFTKVYSVAKKRNASNLQIKGLKKIADEGLKIKINYRSVGKADNLVTKMNTISEGFIKSKNPAVLMEKHKYELLFADLNIYTGETLLLSKSFSKKSLFKTEYVQFYKNKTGKKPYGSGDYKIEFSDIEANALYFVEKDLDPLKKSIYEYINKNIGFNEQKTKFKFYTVKSKEHDYSEMDELKEKVIEAVKNKDKAELNVCYKKWVEMIKEADYTNKNAKYNSAVAGKLFINAYQACLVSENMLSVANLHILIIRGLKKLDYPDLVRITELKEELEKIRRNRSLNKHRF